MESSSLSKHDPSMELESRARRQDKPNKKWDCTEKPLVFSVDNSTNYPLLNGLSFDRKTGNYILFDVAKNQVVLEKENESDCINYILQQDSTEELPGNYPIYDLELVQEDSPVLFYLYILAQESGMYFAPICVMLFNQKKEPIIRMDDYNTLKKEKEEYFLIDTGASVSAIPENLNPGLFGRIIIEGPWGTRNIDTSFARLKIDGEYFIIKPIIASTNKFVLGRDVMQYFHLILNIHGGMLTRNSKKNSQVPANFQIQ